jgi:hypothetical protein
MSMNRRSALVVGLTTIHQVSFAASTPTPPPKQMMVTGAKFGILNGNVPSTNPFFVKSGNNFVLKVKDPSGNALANNKDWIASGFPIPVSLGGLARVGNGQCADFVKYASGVAASSRTWKIGDHVSDYWDENSLIGKVMATFDSNGYDNGHVAVILSAWKAKGSNTITNVWVADANFVPAFGLTVARHEINVNGGKDTTSDLKRYYLVKY